jgi:cellobiose phosphorylase
MEKTIADLLKRIDRLEKKAPRLPGNAFFLSPREIVCLERNDGDSRYPYSADGLCLWAYASGYLSLSESSFFVFPPVNEGKEPYLAFFGGIKKEEGYQPVSLTGVAKAERKDADCRYCVYTPSAAYYLVKKAGMLFALRAFVSEKKDVCFSLFAQNKSKGAQEIYLSSFMNAIMMHTCYESEETKWFKSCEETPQGFYFEGVEDLSREIHLHNRMNIVRATSKELVRDSTTSRAVFAGGKEESIVNAPALKEGCFAKEKRITLFNDTAVAGDILKTTLEGGETVEVDYRLRLVASREEETEDIALNEFEDQLALLEMKDRALYEGESALKMNFASLRDPTIDPALLNSFLSMVLRQVSYGALAKNSSVSLLGVRDVAQMLEGALMNDPVSCRKKILEVLLFEGENGRFTRQYSLPKANEDPLCDTRAFIDQGQWVISLLHSYLAFTGDVSILKEQVGFYNIVSSNRVHRSALLSSVYDHLLRALHYLLGYRDPQSGCLETLYGDWNDAVDGLGGSSKADQPFGNGVSAMASFHLYKNLKEMEDIASFVQDDKEMKADEQAKIQLEKDINSALVEQKGSAYRIIHGWGENHSFEVGSFQDVDHQDRVGAASNAYYVIAGLENHRVEMKETILEAFQRLDSKYGIKTFAPYFDKDAAKVGRIVNLPKGTAENGAVYIHASIFAIKSLFELNESALAFAELKKALPITHSFLTTSPFVMPNSYSENPAIDVDGESMNDWYTGSSNTLLKTLVYDLFGIQPEIGSLVRLRPASAFPSLKATLQLTLKGKSVHLSYVDQGQKKRQIFVNDRPLSLKKDPNGLRYAEVDFSALEGTDVQILVTD